MCICVHRHIHTWDKKTVSLSVGKSVKRKCVCVGGGVCSWLESLGADRLYAWTSISAPPPCSTVQLCGWAHYIPTRLRAHTQTHTPLPHSFSFHPSFSRSFFSSIFPVTFVIFCSYSAPTNFSFLFLLFFCHSVTLFSNTWDIYTSFSVSLSPFLHFLCFFPFVTFCFLLSFSLHSFSIGSLLLSDSSILAPSPSLSFTYTFILIWLKSKHQREGWRKAIAREVAKKERRQHDTLLVLNVGRSH